MAQMNQRVLGGPGIEERRKLVQRSQKIWSDILKGNDYDKDLMTEFYDALALDIASEKKRWLLTNQKPRNDSTNHITELEETGL